MRHVLPSQEVYHRWAHQVQPSAYNSSRSVSFDGRTAFSYRAPIARHVKGLNDASAVLFSPQRWSVTTAKHQGYCRRSIPDSVRVFNVPVLGSDWEWLQDDATSRLHTSNVSYYAKRASELADKASRARSRKVWLESELADTQREANEYCAFFGIAPQFDENTLATLEARIATQRAERAERERIESAEYDAAMRIEHAEKATRWLAGEDVEMYNFPDVLLRVEAHRPEEVATSRGAYVPLTHAERLYRKLLAGSLAHGDRAGDFTVDRVEAEAVQIGCHYITKAEVARFAATQGWTLAVVATA